MNDKKKFNIIDFIIVASVLIIIGISVYRAISIKKTDANMEKTDLVYTLKISELDSIYAYSLSQGDEIYLSEKETMCGTITDIKKEYAKVNREYTAEDGSKYFVAKTDPSKINLTLTVECKGNLSGTLMYLGDSVYVCGGQTLDLYTNSFTFSALLTDYTEK